MMRILTIDGGGIRGLVPAVVLAELERRAGVPTAQMFDLVVGSSTGGLLALGLTAPDGASPRYAAAELAELYEREGPTIFSRPLTHRIRSVGNLLGPKYPDGPIEEVLGRYLGDARLRDAATSVVVTAYALELRRPFFFRSARAVADPAYDWAMGEAARATTAAPTYFPPVQLAAAASDPHDAYALVDGGVFANNPAMVAYAEARTVAPHEQDLVIVSLGTGELTDPIRYEDARGWGLARWARPILEVVFDGVSDTVDYEVRRLTADIQSGTRLYWRLQPTLPPGLEAIDDASRTNIAALRTLARRFVDDHTRDLDAIAAALT
jgi:patatin-like phospholipase/acyl hydrolase